MSRSSESFVDTQEPDEAGMIILKRPDGTSLPLAFRGNAARSLFYLAKKNKARRATMTTGSQDLVLEAPDEETAQEIEEEVLRYILTHGNDYY